MACKCAAKIDVILRAFFGIRMDGSDGDPDYRVKVDDPEKYGTWHRDESGELSQGEWRVFIVFCFLCSLCPKRTACVQ